MEDCRGCPVGSECALFGHVVTNHVSKLCMSRPDYRWHWGGRKGPKPAAPAVRAVARRAARRKPRRHASTPRPAIMPGRDRGLLHWAVGVTAAPRTPRTLEECAASIVDAGWPDLRIFADGGLDVSHLPHPATCRGEKVGAFSNWWLALGELFHREPNADAYLLFQDDCIVAPHAREYLERIDWPKDAGVLSIYTAAGRTQEDKPGFHPVANGKGGMGAVAYIFHRARLKQLLTSEYVLNHRTQPKGTKAIDGTVMRWCRRAKLQECVHTPSLVQHIGERSTLGHGGARGKRRSDSFVGADFDARRLLKGFAATPAVHASTPAKGERLGLVGFNAASGLGYLNRDLAAHLPVERWLVKSHSRFKTLPPHEDCDTITCTSGKEEKMRRFLGGLDAVIFAETPYFDSLLPLCVRMGIHTACVPMAEWLPPGCRGWARLVDVFLSPTYDCHRQIAHVVPSVHIPWPIDLNTFPFRERTVCYRFVFVHGTGGVHDRKGAEFVARAAALDPSLPLLVYSQGAAGQRSTKYYEPAWPKHVEVRNPVAHPRDLYADADVCVQPSRLEGLGLQLLECQASGLPLITTDAPPMHEYNPLRAIPCSRHKMKCSRVVPSYHAQAEALAAAMHEVRTMDLSAASRAAREFVEREHSWQVRESQILEAVFGRIKVEA